MTEMVDRVARAIAKAHLDPLSDIPTDAALEIYGYIGMAKAAIEAMREPTEAMLLELANIEEFDTRLEGWRFVIDVALTEWKNY